MFNKPKGCITAVRDPRHKTVMDYIEFDLQRKIFPVGRLDRDTEGFLLLTDDGKLAYSLMRPENSVSKTYFLYAKGVLTPELKDKLERGVYLLDKKNTFTAPAKAVLLEAFTLKQIEEYLEGKDKKLTNKYKDEPAFSMTLTITEGKKHQVKRMLGAIGCKVLYLKRLSIGNVTLDKDLAPGEYRPLEEDEICALYS